MHLAKRQGHGCRGLRSASKCKIRASGSRDVDVDVVIETELQMYLLIGTARR